MAFQSVVNYDLAPGLEGGFASANQYASMLAGPGQLTAGTGGVVLGRFAFARNDTGVVTNAAPGVAYRIGFMQRTQPVLVTAFLGTSSFTVPQGLEVTLHQSGDFWCRVFAAAVTMPQAGQKCFASTTNGQMQPGAPGATIAGYVETRFWCHSIAAIGELTKISTREPF